MNGVGQIVAAIVHGSARHRQIPVTLGPQRVRLPRAQPSMTETDITPLCRGPAPIPPGTFSGVGHSYC
jgi:hypothetical protein